jgi:hypothetical protein
MAFLTDIKVSVNVVFFFYQNAELGFFIIDTDDKEELIGIIHQLQAEHLGLA